MSKKCPDLFAAIHVGSDQISLQIVEYRSLDDIRVVERAKREVSLGEETFKTGCVSFSSVSEICELLKGYGRMLAEYGVKDYRLMATTALREAQNQHYIIDQIRVKTGFSVEVVDMPQEIYFKYVALFKTVTEHGLAEDARTLLFVDISSGGLGITLYKNGEIKYQQNLHIGALRIKESFDKAQRESVHFHKALAEYIYSTIEPVKSRISLHSVDHLVLSGPETHLFLKMLGRDPEERISFVDLADFNQLYDRLKGLNIAQLMKLFGLTEQKAEMVLPTIFLYKEILSLTEFGQIVIPDNHFIEGAVLLHIGEKTNDPWMHRFEQQVISLAKSLGEKYLYDPNHAGSVCRTSLLLFDKLLRVHGLGKRDRQLLHVATIVHDIGKYVSLRRHYFYSYRLIISSDILGFSETEKEVMANVAYYHSKGTPSVADANFAMLSKDHRILTAKLSAIIRLADSIDRSHRQKAGRIELALRGDELIITVEPKEDYSLEEWTFFDKTSFFEEVFGIHPVLRIKAPGT